MLDFDRNTTEALLLSLDENGCLFPQFGLRQENDRLWLLGTGGFSSVYEMYNKERPERKFALKVIGLQRHTVSSEEFLSTARIQWILCEESGYIMRILGVRELHVCIDDEGRVTSVRDVVKESWEEEERGLHLQFVLMEKLDDIIQKDKFQKVRLARKELSNEDEVIKFAIEIGQALSLAHNNNCLHRDVKLENIFWDKEEAVYKLGDFGIAKYAEDGNAETIVYTDGYGAPEIERRLSDSYNATADIYSFGITLYLLLNDLRFPGSDGYYSKVEVQYNENFIFPAPAHASEAMTRLIRKMCCYRADGRHQSMAEVLAELATIREEEGIELEDELVDLLDLATETYREEKKSLEDDESEEVKPKTRAERKEEDWIENFLYIEDNIKYLVLLTFLLVFLLKGMQPDMTMTMNWMFWMLPIAMMCEAVFQSIKEFHLFLGIAIIVFSLFSISILGLTFPHIIFILCVLIGWPILSLSGALATGLWMALEYLPKHEMFDFLWKYDLGWILLIIVMLAVNRYLHMKIISKRITPAGAFRGIYIYDKIFLVFIILGVVLFVLQKCNLIVISDTISRIHFIRTGIISFIGMMFLTWWDGNLDDLSGESEQSETGVISDDEFLDN